MDKETIMLRAIMVRYGGLVNLKNAIWDDEDSVLLNLCDDVNDEITEEEFLNYFHKIF